MQKQYLQAWRKYKEKDKQVRLILSKIHRSVKDHEAPYRLSKRDIEQCNQAREAWFEFLRVARR